MIKQWHILLLEGTSDLHGEMSVSTVAAKQFHQLLEDRTFVREIDVVALSARSLTTKCLCAVFHDGTPSSALSRSGTVYCF